MKDSGMLDEADSALVHALQISPRAGWARLAEVLDQDAVTLARRWRRLSERGAAWISCYPGRALAESGQGCLAYVEVDCAGDRLPEVAERLSRQPTVTTVEHTTGERDLLLTVMRPDLASLSRWVTHSLGSLPGVTASRTQVAGAIHTEGSRWRLRALRADQVAELTDRQMGVGRPALPPLDELDQAILVALSADGRASYTALAEACGAGTDAVRRRTKRLLGSGAVQVRCEIARPLSGRPVAAVLWVRVPSGTAEQAARRIAGMPQVRLCATVTGRHNLLVVAWVRSVEDIQRLETRVTSLAPGSAVGDRAVALRQLKLSGHLLDEAGYRRGTVPIDAWTDPDRVPAAPG